MHLLATDTATLDEIETAVDLGQTPADVVVLSFSDSDLSALAAAWRADRDALPSLRLASLKRLRHPMSVDLYVDSVIAKSRFVIVRSLGGLDYWRYGFERLAAACGRDIGLVALPGDDRADARLAALSTVPHDALELFDRYFREGGAGNLANALKLAGDLLSGKTQRPASAPVKLGPVVGMTADGTPVDIKGLAPAGDHPMALAVFYRSSLLAADTAPIRDLMQKLAAEGLDPVALAITSLKDPAAAETINALIARRRPAVIINATAFSARRSDDTTILDAADCPVLQVALAGGSQDAWSTSSRGLAPSDLAMNVVLPELDGRLFTRAISFKSETEADDDLRACFAPARTGGGSHRLRCQAGRRLDAARRQAPRRSGGSRSCSRTIPRAPAAPAMPAG